MQGDHKSTFEKISEFAGERNLNGNAPTLPIVINTQVDPHEKEPVFDAGGHLTPHGAEKFHEELERQAEEAKEEQDWLAGDAETREPEEG